MPLPPATSSVETYFDYMEYCAAALHADPDTRDLEAMVVKSNQDFGKTVSARNEMHRDVNRATAVRDFMFRTFMSTVEGFERKASAAFEKGEKDPSYQRIFSKTPAMLGKTAIEDRERVFDIFVAEVAKAPIALAKPAKTVMAAWEAYKPAVKHLVAKQAALAAARAKEHGAKAECMSMLRKLEGKLMDRFPGEPKRVRSYFPPPKSARKTDVVQPPAQEKAA